MEKKEEGGVMLLYGNKWVQRFNPRRLYCYKRIAAFLIDETMLQIVSSEAWLRVVVEPIHKQIILGVYIYFKTQEYDSCRGISQFINKNLW